MNHYVGCVGLRAGAWGAIDDGILQTGDDASVKRAQNALEARESRNGLHASSDFVRNVWVVTIFNGDQTENRSFRHEEDARAYGKARVEQLLSGSGEIRIDKKS